jgi:release factor glutamine methyltransferase
LTAAPITIADAMQQARGWGVDRLDAQLLLAHVLHQSRAWLLAHSETALTAAQAATLLSLLSRRAGGEPLAYVIAESEFRGLRLHVNPAVLIPRPETEVLVEWALELLEDQPATRLVDLGTGSGAIALAIKQSCHSADVWATDLSPAALEVARGNAARLQLPLTWRCGTWWAALPGQRFGLAVSNPPYVAGTDPHLAALSHEPRLALTPEGDPEGDGLASLRALISDASQHLLPGAWLLLEHGHDQAPALHGIFQRAGFQAVQTRDDLARLPRCTGARWPGDATTA